MPPVDHGHVIEMPTPPNHAHPVRVLIVDDDRRVRQSLSGLIALRDGVEVVGTAPDSQRALELVRSASPDTVLLDLRLPHEDDGLGLLALLRRDWPGVRVVAMSVQTDLMDAALAAGAVAFVPKGGPEAIGDALVSVDPASFDDESRRTTH
jgi:DNA-binding NarL/FixJ family response regulator